MSAYDDVKERVKAAVNLADLIMRNGVPLKGGPVEFKALCPFHSEKTPSFTVFLKDGLWGYNCFGCGEAGDVFSWVMRRKSIGFMDALRLLAADISVAMPVQLYQPRAIVEAKATCDRKDRGPFDPSRYVPLVEGRPVWDYLVQQRKLKPEFLTRYSVGQTQDDSEYAFAYKWIPEGSKGPKFEFVKLVRLERPGGKKIERRDPTGGKNILFGMLAVGEARDDLVICEGELDAISWAQFGWSAVSVPGGAGYLGWMPICWDWLVPWKRIHLSFDEDRAGRMKVVEAVKRLGMSRTDIVRLPELPA